MPYTVHIPPYIQSVYSVCYMQALLIPLLPSNSMVPTLYYTQSLNVISKFQIVPKENIKRKSFHFKFHDNHTVCSRSSEPFYIVSSHIIWVTTSWTHSRYNCTVPLSLREDIMMDTVCSRSSDSFYAAMFYIKWVTTSWTHSRYNCTDLCLATTGVFKSVPTTLRTDYSPRKQHTAKYCLFKKL